ncbi:MAG: protein kinase domain-containing protein [Rubripirellula sp.]
MEDSTNNFPTAEIPTQDMRGMRTRDMSGNSDSGDFDLASDAGGEGKIPTQIGDYAIRELIGSGGMGQVFLAEHTRMQRLVAVKMLPVERMKDEVAVSRFYDEVRAASRLMHPNIVTAFDAGESDDVHYLAMEYVDGQTLTRLVAQKGPLPVSEAAAVIRQAALGLLHAHRAGIVHRDVKPGNVMKGADGTIKILDLGLARINSASLLNEADNIGPNADPKKKSKGRLVGTLPFMAPEQLNNPDVADPRSDIYSLGATLFFLLTGRAPFTGDYLELVYGHRHGKIPDLMEARDDVDLQFSNIFMRMMAKSPDERYASFDEVIDELSEYVTQDDTPAWLAEYSGRQVAAESAASSNSGSGASAISNVFAIDLGMFFGAVAETTPTGAIRLLTSTREESASLRMAVASDDGQLFFGAQAMERRLGKTQNLAYCVPMYIGKDVVEREIAGQQCPPEVLLAMMFRDLVNNTWTEDAPPAVTAITIPASYDQLHRQSILQAAEMAGLKSVRLVHRSIAAVQSTLLSGEYEELDDCSTSLEEETQERILFIGVTGMGSEVSVFRGESKRLHQLAISGHWNSGTLPWLQRLVELSVAAFQKEHNFDPRSSRSTVAQLQMACERAMNSMTLLDKVSIRLKVQEGEYKVWVARRHWLQACEDLAARLRKTVKRACRDSSISLSDIDRCVTLGPILKIPMVRSAVLRGINSEVTYSPVDRTDVAKGAAACLAAELPGRGAAVSMPARGVTGQTIGIVVEDVKGRRRILPLIPFGTSLPARTNRRLTVGADRDSMTLSLVESSGLSRNDWQTLGRYEITIDAGAQRARMIGFEIDVNGLLVVRAQAEGATSSNRLPTLPEPKLSDEGIADWTRWLDTLPWDGKQ